MDRKELLDKITEIISDQIAINVDEIDEDTSLEGDLDADSLDMLQIVTAIEDEFNVTIEDEAFENVKTIGDAIDYLEKLI